MQGGRKGWSFGVVLLVRKVVIDCGVTCSKVVVFGRILSGSKGVYRTRYYSGSKVVGIALV